MKRRLGAMGCVFLIMGLAMLLLGFMSGLVALGAQNYEYAKNSLVMFMVGFMVASSAVTE